MDPPTTPRCGAAAPRSKTACLASRCSWWIQIPISIRPRKLALNPAAWTDAPPGTFGASAPYYNDFRWQRQPAESMGFGRIFRIKEGMTLQIRAEFQNIFNRLFYSVPADGVGIFGAPSTNPATGSSTATLSVATDRSVVRRLWVRQLGDRAPAPSPGAASWWRASRSSFTELVGRILGDRIITCPPIYFPQRFSRLRRPPPAQIAQGSASGQERRYRSMMHSVW